MKTPPINEARTSHSTISTPAPEKEPTGDVGGTAVMQSHGAWPAGPDGALAQSSPPFPSAVPLLPPPAELTGAPNEALRAAAERAAGDLGGLWYVLDRIAGIEDDAVLTQWRQAVYDTKALLFEQRRALVVAIERRRAGLVAGAPRRYIIGPQQMWGLIRWAQGHEVGDDVREMAAALPPAIAGMIRARAMVLADARSGPRPRLSSHISVLELARGMAVDESPCLREHFIPHIAPRADGTLPPACPVDAPRALRAVWGRLAAIADPAERRRALPWLLVQRVMRDRSHGFVSTSIPYHERSGDPVDTFMRETLVMGRDLGHVSRDAYAGELDNRAVRAMRSWAPDLIDALSPRDEPVPAAVEEVIARAAPNGEKPLAGFNFVAVQHLVDDNVSTLASLTRLGLDPARAHVVGVPYSTCELASERLREMGMDVDTRVRHDMPYELWRTAQICAALRKALADHERNGEPILVMDDGGDVSRAIAQFFPEHAKKFVVVEQTTRGIESLVGVDVQNTIVNVARSRSKRFELIGLERSLRTAVRQRLTAFADPSFMPGLPAMIMGFGWIGETVASALRSLDRDADEDERLLRPIVVVDPDPDARLRAEKCGYVAVADPEEYIDLAALIAGCTGRRSLYPRHLRRLKFGRVVFSCSSANAEFKLNNDSRVHEDILVVRGDHSYLALGGGFPINFTGKGDINPAEEMQFTRAAMVAGLLQAARIARGEVDAPPGPVQLDPAWDGDIERMGNNWRAHRGPGKPLPRGR